jgi:hypothetical protein
MLPVPRLMKVNDACREAGVDNCTLWKMQNLGLITVRKRQRAGVDVSEIPAAVDEYRWRRKHSGKFSPLFQECAACETEKPIAQFRQTKSKSAMYGYNFRRQCRACELEAKKKKSPTENKDYQREWRSRPEVKVRARARYQEKRQDPKFCLDKRIGKQVRDSLAGGSGWRDHLPFTVEELKKHLERQFLPGMKWSNMSDWHIDHIVPKSDFSYSSPKDEEFQRCWALTNLRPLWAEDNVRKGARREHLL